MRIPLPKMMRHWREREFERNLTPSASRNGMKLWAFFAKRPALYGFLGRINVRVMHALGGRKGRIRSMPFAGRWTAHRDLPAPQGQTFQELWAKRQRSGATGKAVGA